MIQNLFINKKVNPKGKYTVVLYVNGREQLIEIDDWLPWDNETL